MTQVAVIDIGAEIVERQEKYVTIWLNLGSASTNLVYPQALLRTRRALRVEALRSWGARANSRGVKIALT